MCNPTNCEHQTSVEFILTHIIKDTMRPYKYIYFIIKQNNFVEQ